MDGVFSFIFENAQYAHFVVFGLFMLAGLNLPISEDLLIILSGVLSSTVIPANTWKLFLAVFLGAYLSDFIPYYLGRHFGPNLWKLRWFSRMIEPHRLDQIRAYYARYGLMTLIIGRFIPFGVRNCLFLTAGLGRMKLWKFALSDGIACLISNATLFSLAYLFGKNYLILTSRLKFINISFFCAFVIAVIALVWYKKSRIRKKEEVE